MEEGKGGAPNEPVPSESELKPAEVPKPAEQVKKSDEASRPAQVPKKSFFKLSKKLKRKSFESDPKNNWHDRHYKLLFLIPLLMIAFCFVYIAVFYHNTGDFIRKDISLTGGTSITIYESNVSSSKLSGDLSGKLPNLDVTSIYNFGTSTQKAIIVDTTANWGAAQEVLENYLGYSLTQGKNVDVEFTGSTLSNSFYDQIIIAILVAFVFMSVVIFILFRTFVPSMSVILSAFADIFMALVTVDILGIKVSTAGIVAFLMLIGYSVDTDILLTTRMLKRTEGTLDQRIFGAFKTGMTMTLTSIFSIGFALLIVQSFSVVLAQIFEILIIGLFFDMLNTWITNVAILKLYLERKAKKKGVKNEADI
jgi:preprotein translocase subunit SecF